MGVFPGTRSDGENPVVGFWCFEHDPGASDPLNGAGAPEQLTQPDDLFHVDVVAGLASMLLEHAAMTYLGTDDATTEAMRSLSGNTGWTLDVAAGVLMALTAIASPAEFTAEQLTDLAAIYEQQADNESAPVETDDLPGDPCAVCDGSGNVTVPMSGKRKRTEPCEACGGTGRIVDPPADDVGPDDERDAMANEIVCPSCDGTGSTIYADPDATIERCPECDGRGVIDVTGPAEPLVVDLDDRLFSDAVVVSDEATNDERAQADE